MGGKSVVIIDHTEHTMSYVQFNNILNHLHNVHVNSSHSENVPVSILLISSSLEEGGSPEPLTLT